MPIRKTDIAVGKSYKTADGEIRTVTEILGKSHVMYVTPPESMKMASAIAKFIKDVSPVSVAGTPER